MSANVNGGPGLVKVEPDYQGLEMVVSPAEALRRLQELQAFVKSVMVEGTDYGIIPGTDKPSLLQPGAQKLEEIYGFAHTFEDTERICDWAAGFFLFRKRCVLTSRRDGRYIGDGLGSCNSRESRYAYRWAFDNEVPAGIDKATLRSETKQSRKTGKPYTRYRLPNEDIYSLVNTIEKMACKRALVHAVIGATRSAGIFTQDVEDLPQDVFGQAEESRSWQREQAADQAKSVADAHDQRALAFSEQLDAATTEQELRDIMAAIGKAKLPKPYLETLRALAKKAMARVRGSERGSAPDISDADEEAGMAQ